MNQMSALRRFGWTICLSVIALAYFRQPAAAVEIAAGPKGFAQVKPFFTAHCVKCHGPKKQKADLGLHTIRGDLSRDSDLELWESILERLENGEMPPDGEPRPSDK